MERESPKTICGFMTMKNFIKKFFQSSDDITLSNINAFIPKRVLKELDSANRALEFTYGGGGFGNALLLA